MWVCRAGKDSIYFDNFMKEKIIAIPWDGYDFSLKEMKKRDELKEIVRKETGFDNATSVSTWAGQIYNFCVEMKKGDYVIIPSFRSRYYVIAKITGEYKYSTGTDLKHTRKIEIVCENIKREDLSQSLQYSLGAFRTIFKVDDKEIIKRMEEKR